MAAAASGGVGIGHLLRKSMGALKAEIDSARDKTTEGLTICPTHDGVAVQAQPNLTSGQTPLIHVTIDPFFVRHTADYFVDRVST